MGTSVQVQQILCFKQLFNLMDFSEKYELVGKLLKPGEEARSYSEESSDESDGGAELLEKPDKKDE